MAFDGIVFLMCLSHTKLFVTQALPESWRRRISEYFSGSDNSVPFDASSVELVDYSSRNPSEFALFNDEVSGADASRTPAHRSKEDADARLAESTVVDVSDAWSSIVNPGIAGSQATQTASTEQSGRCVLGNIPLQSNPLSHLGSFPADEATEGGAAVVELRERLMALKVALKQKGDVIQQKEHVIQQKEHAIQQTLLVIQQREHVIQQKDEVIRQLQQQSE
jgi:hypothetical protein